MHALLIILSPPHPSMLPMPVMEDAGGVLRRFGWWYLLGVFLSSLSAVFPRSWQSGTGNDWWRESQILLNFTTVCMGVLELCLTSFLALDQTSREQWKASIYPPLPPLSPMCSLVRPLYTKHMYMLCCLATQNLIVGKLTTEVRTGWCVVRVSERQQVSLKQNICHVQCSLP